MRKGLLIPIIILGVFSMAALIDGSVEVFGLFFIVDIVLLVIFLIKLNKYRKSVEAKKGIAVSEKDNQSQGVHKKEHRTEETARVAGANYYKENIKSLAMLNPEYNLSIKEFRKRKIDYISKYAYPVNDVCLEEEPTNEYDPNAIKVLANGLHIGYIKKGSCAHIKKLIREDAIDHITCNIVGGDYKYLEEYDDNEFELQEESQDEYHATLTIVYKQPR